MLIRELVGSDLAYRLNALRSMDDSRYLDIRLKLFITRFICNIERLKRAGRLRAGNFGNNLVSSKNSILHCPLPLTHPLELMLSGYDLKAGSISNWIDFIVGLNDMQAPICAGFCVVPGPWHFKGARSIMFEACVSLARRYMPSKDLIIEPIIPPAYIIDFIEDRIWYHKSKCHIGTTTERGTPNVFTRTR